MRLLTLLCLPILAAAQTACSSETAGSSVPDLPDSGDGPPADARPRDARPPDASPAVDATGPAPTCAKPAHRRVDLAEPETMVSDWGQPVRLAAPINTPCPEDAIEISADGSRLYFLFATDLIDELSPQELFARPNGTYVAQRIGGPADFGPPSFYDLGQGAAESLDGELSFAPDGTRVYFHSFRRTNTGFLQNPPKSDILDIYLADLVDGRPGPGRNLGPPVNSEHADGEHAIHPDGVSLYFASTRPHGGGATDTDLWVSRHDGSTWTAPVNLAALNSTGADQQPCFSADGRTMYFASERDTTPGMAIYRSRSEDGETWQTPELVIRNAVGEPSLTADGQLLYFVHVLQDADGILFDADVWYVGLAP